MHRLSNLFLCTAGFSVIKRIGNRLQWLFRTGFLYMPLMRKLVSIFQKSFVGLSVLVMLTCESEDVFVCVCPSPRRSAGRGASRCG